MSRLPLCLICFALLFGGCATRFDRGLASDQEAEELEIEQGIVLRQLYVQACLGKVDDPMVQSLVQRVGDEVAAVCHRPGLPWSFVAVNDPQPNLIALPGGQVVITRGLLATLANEDELAAHLAHAVAHIVSGQVAAALENSRTGASGILRERDAPNFGVSIALGAILGRKLVTQNFSSREERICDGLAVEYSQQSGYSTFALVTIFLKNALMCKESKDPVSDLCVSHPFSEVRARALEAKLLAISQGKAEPLPAAHAAPLFPALASTQVNWEKTWRILANMATNEAGTKAVSALSEVVQSSPREGVLRSLYAAALFSQDHNDAAIAEAAQGSRLAPEVFLCHLIAAETLLEKNPASAIAHLDRVEELFPGLARVAFLRGNALAGMGRPGEAQLAYRDAVQRDRVGYIGREAATRLGKAQQERTP